MCKMSSCAGPNLTTKGPSPGLRCETPFVNPNKQAKEIHGKKLSAAYSPMNLEGPEASGEKSTEVPNLRRTSKAVGLGVRIHGRRL